MFGLQLQRLRKTAGLSRSALGRLVSVQRLTIQRWERGTHTPKLQVAEQLARAVGGALPYVCPNCGALHVVGEE